MHQLDPKQTSCFLAAIQSGTIRAAAQVLGLEPSTVSRSISALETALATSLLERGRSGVRPTEAGELLVGYLKRTQGELDLLRSEFDLIANMKRGKVSIAVGGGFVGDLFDNAVAEFSKQYPDITFGLSVGSTEQVVHLVTSEQAHLGLAYNVKADPQIRIEKSSTQRLTVLVRKAGAFDTGIEYDLRALAKIPCAIPPMSFGIGDMIAAAEAKHGIRLHTTVETGSIAAIKAFVRNDLGCAILPKFVCESEISGGDMIAHPIAAQVFDEGESFLVRKAGRKLPQAARLLIPYLKRLSAFA